MQPSTISHALKYIHTVSVVNSCNFEYIYSTGTKICGILKAHWHDRDFCGVVPMACIVLFRMARLTSECYPISMSPVLVNQLA